MFTEQEQRRTAMTTIVLIIVLATCIAVPVIGMFVIE
jgi:hypothetical protein